MYTLHLSLSLSLSSLLSQYPSFLLPGKQVPEKSLLLFLQNAKPGCAPCTLKLAQVASSIDVICPWPGRSRITVMNEVDARLPATCGKVVSFILWSAGCCLHGTSHSTSVLWKFLLEGGQNSDWSIFRRRLFQCTHRRRFWSTAVDRRGKSWISGCSKLERKWRDENLPLFYTQPSFQWVSCNYVPPEPSTRAKPEHCICA